MVDGSRSKVHRTQNASGTHLAGWLRTWRASRTGISRRATSAGPMGGAKPRCSDLFIGKRARAAADFQTQYWRRPDAIFVRVLRYADRREDRRDELFEDRGRLQHGFTANRFYLGCR